MHGLHIPALSLDNGAMHPKRLQCRRIQVKPDLVAIQNKYVLDAEENCLQMI
jgi:hypothetical protein